jgi:hypothetical protein
MERPFDCLLQEVFSDEAVGLLSGKLVADSIACEQEFRQGSVHRFGERRNQVKGSPLASNRRKDYIF